MQTTPTDKMPPFAKTVLRIFFSMILTTVIGWGLLLFVYHLIHRPLPLRNLLMLPMAFVFAEMVARLCDEKGQLKDHALAALRKWLPGFLVAVLGCGIANTVTHRRFSDLFCVFGFIMVFAGMTRLLIEQRREV